MLSDLVTDILSDFQKVGDEQLLTSDQVTGWAKRAIICLRMDLALPYEMISQNVSPIMPPEHREIWIVRTKMYAVEYLRNQAAPKHMFKSADKEADRREEAKRWAEDAAALENQYKELVLSVNPSYQAPGIRPGLSIKNGVFERGIHRIHRNRIGDPGFGARRPR